MATRKTKLEPTLAEEPQAAERPESKPAVPMQVDGSGATVPRGRGRIAEVPGKPKGPTNREIQLKDRERRAKLKREAKQEGWKALGIERK